MKKIYFILLLLLLMFNSTNMLYAKGRWIQVGDNWRYERHKGGGDYITERWYEDINANKVYYFDYDGNMVTGNIVINGKLYSYGNDGAAITTGIDLDGVHYATSGKGEVLGLPKLYDLSSFKVAKTEEIVFANNMSKRNLEYFDDSNTSPTAPSNNNIYG